MIVLGHPQPPTPIHADDFMAAVTSNNNVKRRRSRAMDMKYVWLVYQVYQHIFSVQLMPLLENMYVYHTRNFSFAHSMRVRQ